VIDLDPLDRLSREQHHDVVAGANERHDARGRVQQLEQRLRPARCGE
jgi:hypothetical protein